jgi:hypothetical protein
MSILYQNFTKNKIVKIQNDANRKRKTKKKKDPGRKRRTE